MHFKHWQRFYLFIEKYRMPFCAIGFSVHILRGLCSVSAQLPASVIVIKPCCKIFGQNG